MSQKPSMINLKSSEDFTNKEDQLDSLILDNLQPLIATKKQLARNKKQQNTRKESRDKSNDSKIQGTTIEVTELASEGNPERRRASAQDEGSKDGQQPQNLGVKVDSKLAERRQKRTNAF